MYVCRLAIWIMVAAGIYWQGLVLASQPAADGQERAASTLHYRAEWRTLHAGNITLALMTNATGEAGMQQADLHLETTGLVRNLYKVDNHYSTLFDSAFCTSSAMMELHEGSKHRRIDVTFQQPPGKASYLERDTVKDQIVSKKDINVPACVHDELAALERLRTMDLKTGDSVELPVSNGKKAISARVEVGKREYIQTPSGVYKTLRYEAFLYKNQLYRRDARLFIWLTEDERRLPVRIRVRFRFYIGTITLDLASEETT